MNQIKPKDFSMLDNYPLLEQAVLEIMDNYLSHDLTIWNEGKDDVLKDEMLVPYDYLRRCAIMRNVFRRERHGATTALSETISEMCHAGKIKRYEPFLAVAKFGLRTPLYEYGELAGEKAGGGNGELKEGVFWPD